MDKCHDLNQIYAMTKSTPHHMELVNALESTTDGDAISLTTKEMHRPYLPRSASIIIKVFGKKLSYVYLKSKLQDLWNPIEPLTLIDLGNNFRTVKFKLEASMNKVLREGP